jgi:hypothetical protein
LLLEKRTIRFPYLGVRKALLSSAPWRW